MPDEFYNELKIEARRKAFTVSGLATIDQVVAVKEKLGKIIANGGTLADFQKWAKEEGVGLSMPRLETIYRNNVQAAYNSGQWRSFEASKAWRPFLMYDAINDSRTRPHHLAMDGIIRPVGDKFWETHSPPMGHRCRCTLISLNAKQAEDRSRGGNGLNMPQTDEMAADDEGWGRKPTEWVAALDSLSRQKLGEIKSGKIRVAAARRLKWVETAD
jgi:SPP1 gp7 family putative phage head morphogenesis protein